MLPGNAALVSAYRAFAASHPQLYRLMTERPLPREQLEPGLEDRAAAALVRAAGSPERARAAFAFIHGWGGEEVGTLKALWRPAVPASRVGSADRGDSGGHTTSANEEPVGSR